MKPLCRLISYILPSPREAVVGLLVLGGWLLTAAAASALDRPSVLCAAALGLGLLALGAHLASLWEDELGGGR